MTTPAHCTRTWRTAGDCPVAEYGRHHCSALDSYHHVQHVCECGNVEPPADVQATPDPRLDVVARIEHLRRCCDVGDLEYDDRAYAQTILDALDAMRPDETGPDSWSVGYRAGVSDSGVFAAELAADATPAPAGLSAAQEIRLRVYETGDWSSVNTIDEWAAWVEHGNDETPASHAGGGCRLVGLLATAEEARDEALARAGLAEARLGQVADIVKDRYGMAPGDFADAVRDALAWTPDDTATAGTRDPNCIAQWPECVSGGYDPRCCRFPKSCSCESWNDTAPADVPERSSRGFCGPTAPAGAATGDGDGDE